MTGDLHSCIGVFPSDLRWRRSSYRDVRDGKLNEAIQIGFMHGCGRIGGLRVVVLNEYVSGELKGYADITDDVRGDVISVRNSLNWGREWV